MSLNACNIEDMQHWLRTSFGIIDG